MTYARYLAVGGFKSFRDWNLLEFSPGVSVLVGGNGTGKTSLVEALLWALGEDDRSMLRIENRDDLLYRSPADGGPARVKSEREQHLLFLDPAASADGAGTPETDPPDVDEAAVYLVLGDESQACACDEIAEEAEESCCCVPAGEQRTEVPEGLVTVSRRLSRDGREELQVDGEPANREDVDRSLAPHGLNRSVVSVIRQGELERILLADPPLRARILAETAGIPMPPYTAHGNGSRVGRDTSRLVRAALRRWNTEARVKGGEQRILAALGLPTSAEDRHEAPSDLREATARVRERAAHYFDRLAPGGSLAVDLLEEDGAGGPELHIRVRFPGCDEEGVETLSGGQRSLVAFSLGVAFFQETPSRLMVLDEVEPALDESNLRRFNDVLHEIAEDRQVVVVSHQRRTKDVGDVVFGVDLTGDGASMLHFRFVPETQQLIVFGRVRGNWLERTAGHERDQAPRGPRSASQPEPKGKPCC